MMFRGKWKKTLAGVAGGVVGAILMLVMGLNPFAGGQSPENVFVNPSNHQQSDLKTASLQSAESRSIPDIVQASNPAVVLIKTYVKQGSRSGQGNPFYFNDPFFRYFFGDSSQEPNSANDGKMQLLGAGSGFFYKSDGYILTNEHVINGADRIEVTVQGEDEPYVAKVLGKSAEHDLAVLKIKGDKPFSTLSFGDSDQLNVGDWVVAIGNPFGFEHTVTVGVISAKERDIPVSNSNGQKEYKHLLQTDASINSGNSGGPLIDLNGKVIGINTAKSMEAQGIGFAIPSSVVVPLIDYLEAGKPIPSSYIGVSVVDIDANWMKTLNLESREGAMVVQVLPGSPAYKAGLRQYDVIVQVNNQKIKNKSDLEDRISAAAVGDKLKLTVIRDGKPIEFTVVVGDRNAAAKTNS